ncbi:MAG: class I SAM-dependent methyltransferase [Candidatus Nanoarchaeia archaeon]
MKILDIGCGLRKYKPKQKNARVIGLDIVKLPGVDVVHDLEKSPLPFKDNEFDTVIANHVLEHVKNLISVIHEIWRITKRYGLF